MAETFVQIRGLAALQKRLQALSPEVLRACGPTLNEEARDILSASMSAVPRLQGELASSGFVGDAEVDSRRSSTTATAGFDSPHAAYAHEGFHWGRKTEAPKFLERAANGRGSALAKKIGDAMLAALKRLEGK